jgi:hypothetical protein
MLGSSRIASRQFPGLRFTGLLIAGTASLLLGACAHNVAETPALQWQVHTVEATEGSGATYGAAETSPATGCGESGGDGCYVYRGGRDPYTGLAYTQL